MNRGTAGMEAKAGADHLENISKVLRKVRDYGLLILTFILYRITRIFVTSFQKFTWAVTGVEKTRRDARSGLNFRQGAHVQEIKWRRKIHPMDVADPSNFITFHKGFKHPTCVLKPSVSLFCITRTEAVFVEVDEDALITNSKSGDHFYNAQFKHAKRIISLPHGVFHKVASDLGDPKIPVVWISSTGRCGATLLSRMFEEVPGTQLLDEPDCLTNLAFLKKDGAFSAKEYDNMLASAARLLCKPDDRAGMICIKTRPLCCVQIKNVNRMLPQIRHLFLYRNSLRTVTSYVGSMSGDTLGQCTKFVVDNAFLSTVLPFFRKILYHYFCYVLDNNTPVEKPSGMSTVGIFTCVWAACLAQAIDCTENGVRVVAILYDELMKNPRRSCGVLFDMLNIRAQYANSAVQAFKTDTTNGMTQTFTNNESRRTLPPEMRAEADGILKKYGLPKLGERFEMHGLANFDPPVFGKALSRDRLL